MATKSLRLRLLAAATVAIFAALSLSGLVLSRIFSQHVEAREFAELRNHLVQILSSVEIDGEGAPQVTAQPADPRFTNPNGGLYWQIDVPGGARLRSRSLWETELGIPAVDGSDGLPRRAAVAGPGGQNLLALHQDVTIGAGAKARAIRLMVAVDRHDLDRASTDFRNVLAASLGVLGLALVLASLVQVHVGLRPLTRLRAALRRIHAGTDERIAGEFVSEVQPLITDVNALLLRERQNQVAARERAADLAHGFKTPLAILGAVARDLQRAGASPSANEIHAQIEIMGRHVRHELARARTVGASSIRRTAVPIRPVIDKIVAALGRISNDRGLQWSIDTAGDPVFAGDEGDLLELVGNLAENAAKWASTRVTVRGREVKGRLMLVVEDDGQGIPAGTEAEVLQRGKRLDEATAGTGLGLSIVAKIVDTYGGTIALRSSPTGGLSVEIELPSRPQNS